jgi:Tol biopolymer transport system component
MARAPIRSTLDGRSIHQYDLPVTTPTRSLVTAILEQLNAALGDRYTLERELGQGGMATVYLASDLRHDRKVALKVLRPELAAILGAERFLQEIKTTANLQHPHILGLHDSGEAGGSVFYVMPYVEGESLRDRLNREHQLPVDDAVRIAKEVASALDYAHRHGVVHRDIKPENILLHDGQALVADFGIALAASRSDGGTRMTETGMSLGTPHYMAPEQAMGEREITPKADIYALGCVLYEMLTAEPPFQGATAQAIIARVMTEEPRRLTLQRKTIPPHVEAAVETALAKLPADRFASAAEFIDALDGKMVARTVSGSAASSSAARRPGRATLALAGVAVLTSVAALWGWLRPRPERPVNRYDLGLPDAQTMAQGVTGVNLAVSPDSRTLAYLGPGTGSGQLWLRRRDRLEATAIPGTDGATNEVFSPDGRQIAYLAGSSFTLKVVSTDGGPSVTLAEPGSGAGGGLAWSDDGWIYFDGGSLGYNRIRPGGGTPELIFKLDSASGEQGLAFPQALPGGKQVVFRTRRGQALDEFDLVIYDVATRRRHLLTRGLMARYLDPGYLAVVRSDGTLLAARFEPGDTALRGPLVPLEAGIMTKALGSVDLVVAPDGTLIYVPGTAATSSARLAIVSREGTATLVQPPVGVVASANRGIALSPDGTRLVIDQLGDRGVDLWVKQLPSGPFSRLTFEGSLNFRPSWLPDGRSVLFLSNRSGSLAVWRQRADGGAPAELVYQPSDTAVVEAVLSRDGQWLAFRATPGASRDVFAIRLGRDTAPRPLLNNRFAEDGIALSPDGRWLAYTSDESGTVQVYVRPFPDVNNGRWQISTDGGAAARWSHSGRELFYISAGNEMMAVPVTTGATFSAGAPKRLFTIGTGYVASSIVPYYDITPDDRRFFMLQRGPEVPGTGHVIVVENWRKEVMDKVRADQK